MMHLLLLVSHSGTSPAYAVLILSAVDASPEITKLDLQASMGSICNSARRRKRTTATGRSAQTYAA